MNENGLYRDELKSNEIQEIVTKNYSKYADVQYANKENDIIESRKPVTHSSDDAKLHSRNKIIEAKIECEEDIDEIKDLLKVLSKMIMTKIIIALQKAHFFGGGQK